MRTNPLIVCGGVLLALTIFAGDLLFGLGVAVGVPYAFVVLLSRVVWRDLVEPELRSGGIPAMAMGV